MGQLFSKKKQNSNLNATISTPKAHKTWTTYTRNLTIVGDLRVGKSALTQKYVENKCMEIYVPTVGVDFQSTEYFDEEQAYKFYIFDVSGDKRFLTIVNSYFRNAEGIIICYDVTNKESFENIDRWMHHIKSEGNDYAIHFLVALKSDLYRQRLISYEQGKSLADKYGIVFHETSLYCDLYKPNDRLIVGGFINESRDNLLPHHTMYNIPYLVINCVLGYYSKGNFQFNENCVSINDMFSSICQSIVDKTPTEIPRKPSLKVS